MSAATGQAVRTVFPSFFRHVNESITQRGGQPGLCPLTAPCFGPAPPSRCGHTRPKMGGWVGGRWGLLLSLLCCHLTSAQGEFVCLPVCLPVSSPFTSLENSPATTITSKTILCTSLTLIKAIVLLMYSLIRNMQTRGQNDWGKNEFSDSFRALNVCLISVSMFSLFVCLCVCFVINKLSLLAH